MILTEVQSLENLKFPVSRDGYCSKLYPVMDNTFLFFQFTKLSKKTTLADLVHCDSKGEIVTKYHLAWQLGQFAKYKPFLCMPFENTVIVTEYFQDRLTQINLTTHEVI